MVEILSSSLASASSGGFAARFQWRFFVDAVADCARPAIDPSYKSFRPAMASSVTPATADRNWSRTSAMRSLAARQ
jgi:hypothetical protein